MTDLPLLNGQLPVNICDEFVSLGVPVEFLAKHPYLERVMQDRSTLDDKIWVDTHGGHTQFSWDGILDETLVALLALGRGASYVCYTDHDSTGGYLSAVRKIMSLSLDELITVSIDRQRNGPVLRNFSDDDLATIKSNLRERYASVGHDRSKIAQYLVPFPEMTIRDPITLGFRAHMNMYLESAEHFPLLKRMTDRVRDRADAVLVDDLLSFCHRSNIRYQFNHPFSIEGMDMKRILSGDFKRSLIPEVINDFVDYGLEDTTGRFDKETCRSLCLYFDRVVHLASKADAIEVCNSERSRYENMAALLLAMALNKPIVGGSDNHFGLTGTAAVTTVQRQDKPIRTFGDFYEAVLAHTSSVYLKHGSPESFKYDGKVLLDHLSSVPGWKGRRYFLPSGNTFITGYLLASNYIPGLAYMTKRPMLWLGERLGLAEKHFLDQDAVGMLAIQYLKKRFIDA